MFTLLYENIYLTWELLFPIIHLKVCILFLSPEVFLVDLVLVFFNPNPTSDYNFRQDNDTI